MKTTIGPVARLGLAGALAAWVVLALLPLRRPEVRPATAPANEFSAGRAMVHVRAIAQRPHPTGSAENARVRDYIQAELSAIGMASELQAGTITIAPRPGRKPPSGYVENIVSRAPGRASTRPILLMAHYDSVRLAPGAADDASGVAVLLETARALRTAPQPRNDIVLLFTDSEERALLGSTLFARQHPLARQACVVINLDCGANGGKIGLSLVTERSLWLLRELRASAPNTLGSSLFTRAVLRRMSMVYDLGPLADAGATGISLGFQDHVAFRHRPEDDVTRLDARSVQELGDSTLALARRLADGDLRDARSGDAEYLWTRLTGLVVYPIEWALPLASIAAAALAIATLAGRRRRARGTWIAIPLALLAVAQLWMAAWMPGGSNLLTWPLLSAVVAFAALVTASTKIRPWRLGLLMVTPAPVFLLLAVLVRESFTLIPLRAIQLWAPAVAGICLVIFTATLPQIVLLVRRADEYRDVRPEQAGSPRRGAPESLHPIC